MIFKDFHIHTSFCDGKDAPEEIIRHAIDKGFKALGLCTHSYTDFDESYCIKKAQISDFKKEIASLKAKYKNEIEIFCGVEQDFYSSESTAGFDYVIGSVHYVKCGENYISVDESKNAFSLAVSSYFGGDVYAFCEEYYKTVSSVISKTNGDIIGHFDLISKFNESNRFFNESNLRYKKAYRAALDALIPFKKPFEINTGAISRGYRTSPYPAFKAIEYIKDKGGKFILSSDSHQKETIGFGFKEYKNFADKNGLSLV